VNESFHERPDRTSDEASTRELIRLAGRRQEPGPLRSARVRTVVEAEWRRSVRRRRAHRSLWLLGTAAAAALAVVVWLRAPSPQSDRPTLLPPETLATLARIAGQVIVTQPGSLPRSVAEGERVTAGTSVDTNPGGRVAFQLQNGASVRIDARSRVVFEAAARITLDQGRLYVDSGGTQNLESVQVVTRSGIVRDTGTQFEVAASQSAVQIRVREGDVRIDGPSVGASLGRGESLRVDSDGRLERSSIATHGSEWSWVEALAPQLAIEGTKLQNFLQWASREQGVDWRFKDATAARHGEAVVLHGSISGLTPSEALDAVLPACGMAYEIRSGRLVVGLAGQ
jgi:ferric-dicitrate binding protein FerR (iron transport regulator)